jgi:hypothetical protein
MQQLGSCGFVNATHLRGPVGAVLERRSAHMHSAKGASVSGFLGVSLNLDTTNSHQLAHPLPVHTNL